MTRTSHLFVALCVCSIVFSERIPCPETEPDYNSTSYCVKIGNQIYSNITEGWTSRITGTGGWFAIVIPATCAAIMVAVMMWYNFRYRLPKVQRIRYGEELYKLITETPDPSHPHYDLFNKPADYVYLVRQATLEECSEEDDRGVEEGQYGIFIRGSEQEEDSKVWLNLHANTRFVGPDWVPISAQELKPLLEYSLQTLYNRNMLVIYFKEYCGEQLYKWITDPDPDDPHFDLFDKPKGYMYQISWRSDGLYVLGHDQEHGREVRVCANKDGKQFEWVRVTAKVLKNSQMLHSRIKKKVPKLFKLVCMIVSVFIGPAFKLFWDVVDVWADCYYFSKLEQGSLIDEDITRNVHVNNAILVFAILGALKAVLLVIWYVNMMRNNYSGSSNYTGVSQLNASIAAFIKIVAEDGVELLLEYSFIDKYITQSPPWFLVAKDVVTAIIYIKPIVNNIMSARKTFALLSGKRYGHPFSQPNQPKRFTMVRAFWFVLCTSVHLIFCVVAVTRVAGMVFQFTTQEIPRECLMVEHGQLIQTPFTMGCLNGFDWVILVLLGVVPAICCVIIAVAVVVLLLFVIVCSPCLAYFSCRRHRKWIQNNHVKFVINGETHRFGSHFVEECAWSTSV